MVSSASRRDVAAVAVSALDLALIAPFGISGGSLPQARNVLVTVTLSDGTRGHGEGAPLPAYNGETQEGVLADLRRAERTALGRSAEEWAEIGADLQGSGSARCALETALLDALCRSQGRSLTDFFGGRTSEVETDMTVTTGGVEEAAAAARAIAARGIRTVKVKVGGTGGPEADLARIAAIARAAPEAPLILDGNAGFGRADALQLVRGLKQRGIAPALLEQWLPKTDLAGLRLLAEESGWPVAADESVVTAADVEKLVRERAAQVVNVKLMKAGVAEAWAVVRAAREAGLGLMIGGNVESILGMTMAACFAAGLGGFRFADLDTPWFLAANPFEGGYRATGGVLSVAHIAAGHGVAPAAADR